MAKRAFRAESGLDAGGHNVQNVAKPRDGQVLDGVNVQYFIENNTVQHHSNDRDYPKDFAVIYQNRIWIAKQEITAGEFDASNWEPVRTDSVWEIVNGTVAPGMQLESGQYISANSTSQELTFILPNNPLNGDTIVVLDEGRSCNTKAISVRSPNKPFDHGGTDELFTIKGSMKTFIYSSTAGGRWNVHTSCDLIESQFVVSSATETVLSTGDEVYKRTSTGQIKLQLPKYAVHGDTISTYDLDGLNTTNGTVITIYPESGHSIGSKGKTSHTSNSAASTHFVFDGVNSVWVIYSNDLRPRWKFVRDNYSAKPFDHISVVTDTAGQFDITLPVDAEDGDYLRISNYYAFAGVDVNIKVDGSTTHKILGNENDYVYPKYSTLPKKFVDVKLYDNVTINEDYAVVLEFTFDDTNNTWHVTDVNTRIERVDENNRNRPGIAPLADQNEVNKNHEQSPKDDMIVTPLTLSKKTASETRRGIARLATKAEMQTSTDATTTSTSESLVSTIVTPQSLNSRQSTETIRGVAEVATQAEANSSDNDTHIVTPKKLNSRRATASMAGVVKIVNARSSTPSTSRSESGTGVYNWSDASHNEPFVLTPKNLNEAQATEFNRGTAYIATQGEANTQGSSALDTVIITPKKLDARRALETMAGIVEVATQAEVNAGTLHNPYVVTPKTLSGRKASETLEGVIAIATVPEVHAGAIDNKAITPIKFKEWTSHDQFFTHGTDGLHHEGNLWEGYDFEIYQSSEVQRGTARVATVAETNELISSKLLDNVIITPKKLDARRATESLAGIAEIASQQEVDLQTDNTRIVTPKQLAWYIHNANNSNATESVSGTVDIATKGDSWVGNTTDGSTKAVDSYEHAPNVITPRTMNYALQNYLPKTAKAVDSDKFDGLDSTQFLRSDTNDTLSGLLTHTNVYEQKMPHSDSKSYGVRLIAVGNSVYMQGGCATDPSTGVHNLTIGGYNGESLNSLKLSCKSSEGAVIEVGSSNFKIYHEGHKPSPAEIGSYTKGEADSRFVNVTGDTMTGTLTSNPTSSTAYSFQRLPTYTTGSKTYLRKFRGGSGDSIWHETVQGGYYKLSTGNTDDALQIEIGNQMVNAPKGFKVGSTAVIEADAKINWNKLKSVPNATTAVAGIVQLNNALDNSSTTQAATANTVKILKEMIDEKVGITGSVFDDVKIRNWLRIGNVILRPNASTKSLDFIWTDDPL